MGEQAIDAGDHPRQRPAAEADGDETGEGEGDGAGVVGPVDEQPEGDDDDGGFGGNRHAPADPLHAAPVLGAGLDVAGVGAVQADAKVASQNTTSGQTRTGVPGRRAGRDRSRSPWRSRRARCCDGSAWPDDRRPARATDGGRSQGAVLRRGAGDVPGHLRGTVEGAVGEHHCGEGADRSDDRSTDDDRGETLVPSAQAEQQSGGGPQHDEDRTDDLHRRRPVAEGDRQG